MSRTWIDIQGKVWPEKCIKAILDLAIRAIKRLLARLLCILERTTLSREILILCDIIVIQIDQGAESGMSHRTMIAFKIVVYHHFPIGSDFKGALDATLYTSKVQSRCLQQLRQF